MKSIHTILMGFHLTNHRVLVLRSCPASVSSFVVDWRVSVSRRRLCIAHQSSEDYYRITTRSLYHLCYR